MSELGSRGFVVQTPSQIHTDRCVDKGSPTSRGHAAGTRYPRTDEFRRSTSKLAGQEIPASRMQSHEASIPFSRPACSTQKVAQQGVFEESDSVSSSPDRVASLGELVISAEETFGKEIPEAVCLPQRQCSKDGVWHVIRYPDQRLPNGQEVGSQGVGEDRHKRLCITEYDRVFVSKGTGAQSSPDSPGREGLVPKAATQKNGKDAGTGHPRLKAFAEKKCQASQQISNHTRNCRPTMRCSEKQTQTQPCLHLLRQSYEHDSQHQSLHTTSEERLGTGCDQLYGLIRKGQLADRSMQTAPNSLDDKASSRTAPPENLMWEAKFKASRTIRGHPTPAVPSCLQPRNTACDRRHGDSVDSKANEQKLSTSEGVQSSFEFRLDKATQKPAGKVSLFCHSAQRSKEESKEVDVQQRIRQSMLQQALEMLLGQHIILN